MHKESFVRWQTTTIQQLGYSINLILALSTASLGFALNLAKDCDFHTCWTKVLFSQSIFFFVLSIGLGIAGTVNRLRDFRKTTGIARDREDWRDEGIAEIDSKLSDRRAQTRRLGSRTWCLFCLQVGTFVVGILLLISAFGITYRAKLF